MIYTKEQAYTEIAKLVNTFKTSETRLNIEAEAQIENNFIRPLFKYLNWNTENDGLAIPDYEFVVQRTNRYGKRPDYILQLDGQHLLVIDAKQVKLDMHDPRWMNQVYAYAYSTQNLSPSRKIDFAILTDFQEFVALDCTLYAGKPKAVANFRVLDWRYEDYLTQFDMLWELFERENMRQAARTRGTDAPAGLWARALSPKKVKANRIPPDKAFLMEMDDDKTGWRVRLAKDMKKHNPEADGALITAAVQLLIDRLIFVKALSDREIEDDYLSQLAETVERDGLAESNTGWFTACRTIFTKLNEFYNGSIFESRPELEAVTVSNKVVRAIIHDLQPENSSYNFAVLPVEILGTIYERFLGRVVRTTDKQVKIEDKPEVRKAGGVYYTPQYIVNYIVQNTVGKLLEKCQTPEDVAQLRILDPACGSGSFLLGAYNALIEWYIRYYSDKARLTKQDRTAVYHDSDGRVRLTAKLKRQILLNNLYGVDIDPQAVEVTRFSLSLKALEDIRQGEVYEERNLFKQTVLPNLSQNIKCGNSLIGPDYFAGQMFSDPDELMRVNPFDWEQQFPHGSFDAVIGNPPYVQAALIMDYKEYFKNKYSTFSGNSDLYVFFVEQSFKVLGENGIYGMIISNKWLKADYGLSLRKYLSNKVDICQILDFGELPVFEGVGTFPCIIIGAHRTAQCIETKFVPIKELPPKRSIESQIVDLGFQIDLRDSNVNHWVLVPKDQNSILSNISKYSTLLKDYPGLTIRRGVVTGYNPAFIIDGETKERLIREDISSADLIQPFVSGDETRRYSLSWQGRYLIFARRGIDISNYPSILNYLSRWRNELEPRKKNTKDKIGRKPGIYKWYEIQDSTSYYEEFDKPKIVYGQFQIAPHFCFSPSTLYFGSNHYMVVHNNMKFLHYLLGILNSKLYFFYMKSVAGVLGDADEGGRLISQKSHILKFPVHNANLSDQADKARHDKMVQLVESMLALHKHKAAAKTQAAQDLYIRQIEATDREIDALVYELYGLTPEEIAVMEAT